MAGLLLWLTPALWSSNYIIARAASGVLHPHALALGRWTLALLLMLPWVWPERQAIVAEWRQRWPQLLLLGALGMWICGAFVYLGAQGTSATNIGLIYAATPVGIAVAGRWLLHEPGSAAQRVALGLALLGVLFVIAAGEPARLLQARFGAGDLWIVAAALSWVAYTVLQQRWPTALSPRARLAGITAGGLLVLLPFTLLEWARLPALPFSGRAAGLVVLAAVVPGFLSYQAYAYLLRALGATRSGVVMYLSPLYAAGLAWLLLAGWLARHGTGGEHLRLLLGVGYDATDRGVLGCEGGQAFQPARVHSIVVVAERDEVPRRFRDARVARVTGTGPLRRVDPAQAQCVRIRVPPQELAQPVGGAVVGDDHLHVTRVGLGHERVELVAEQVRSVVDRDHHRHQFGRRAAARRRGLRGHQMYQHLWWTLPATRPARCPAWNSHRPRDTCDIRSGTSGFPRITRASVWMRSLADRRGMPYGR